MSSFTLDDHAKAVEALASLSARRDNYSGNNPNKFRADIEHAQARLATIELALKRAGVLPQSAAEERDAELDLAFPDAQSQEVVTWQGKRFVKRFTPTGRSLSGKTVLGWKSHWQETKG